MYLKGPEDFRTLIVDPGEDAGWCTACGNVLVSAGTTKLWHLADAAWEALQDNTGQLGGTGPQSDPHVENDDVAHLLDLPIKRIVLENFRLYPWLASKLAFDEFRTIRLIGALQFMSRVKGLEFHTQPASIKELSEIGGAEAFFDRPLHENRHQNDAKRHWWYFVQFGPEGSPLVKDSTDA